MMSSSEEGAELLSKFAFFLRAAVKYDLIASKRISEISKNIETSTTKTELLQLIQSMFYYYCGRALFYHLVYGKEVKGPIPDLIKASFGRKSIRNFHGVDRFNYSYESANQILNLLPEVLAGVPFIFEVNISATDGIVTAKWTEGTFYSRDVLDQNNVVLEYFMADRIKKLNDEFNSYFNSTLTRYKIKLIYSKITNKFDLATDYDSCSVKFEESQKVKLNFKPDQFFKEMVELKYADDRSFMNYKNSLREEWKTVQCSALREMKGGILNDNDKLYYFQKRTGNIRAGEDEDTQEQNDRLIKISTQEQEQDKFIEDNFTSASATLSNEGVASANQLIEASSTQVQQDKEGISNTSSSALIVFSEVQKEYEVAVATHIVSAILTQKKFRREKIRTFMEALETVKHDIDFVNVHLNICKYYSVIKN